MDAALCSNDYLCEARHYVNMGKPLYLSTPKRVIFSQHASNMEYTVAPLTLTLHGVSSSFSRLQCLLSYTRNI